jgi:hypothetical protein
VAARAHDECLPAGAQVITINGMARSDLWARLNVPAVGGRWASAGRCRTARYGQIKRDVKQSLITAHIGGYLKPISEKSRSEGGFAS